MYLRITEKFDKSTFQTGKGSLPHTCMKQSTAELTRYGNKSTLCHNEVHHCLTAQTHISSLQLIDSWKLSLSFRSVSVFTTNPSPKWGALHSICICRHSVCIHDITIVLSHYKAPLRTTQAHIFNTHQQKRSR